MGNSATSHAGVVEIDDAPGAFEVFDAVCRRQLHIDGHEFLRRWDDGQYKGIDSDEVDGLPEVLAVLSLAR